jgi:signal transduction histidine kinase
MIALMRCVLAVCALAIIYIDPTEPTRYVGLTYASLIAYCVWSLGFLLAASRDVARDSPWFDVAWATYLIALTEGTSSIFFFLFLFAILVASFSGGYRAGIRVSVASSLIFCGVGLLFPPAAEDFELSRSLIRPVYLLVLGWMMSVWGGREMMLRQRLALLREVGSDWNPRLGVERAAQGNLRRVLEFFAARECVLAIRRSPDPSQVVLYRVGEANPSLPTGGAKADAAAAELLLDLPRDAAFAFDARSTADARAPQASRSQVLARLLEARAFATVPLQLADETAGRLFVTRDAEPFSEADVAFLEQLAVAMSHTLQNTQLIEELVLKAAEHERFRISLDLHDSTVQPYIGLKLGLDALHREAEGNPLQRRIRELLDMADLTIQDLRGFATGVRESAPISGDSLLKAVRQQAERFRRFYGLDVQLESDEVLFIGPQHASEAFRMISEGLSNVIRHTHARRAWVRITRDEKDLRVVIANEPWVREGEPPRFTPRSINARALSLGGSSFVEHPADGSTAVHISIPV